MNATLRPASQPFSPLSFSASEENLKSGSEMKHQWIGPVLAEMQRTNEVMGRQRRNETHRITRSAKKLSA